MALDHGREGVTEMKHVEWDVAGSAQTTKRWTRRDGTKLFCEAMDGWGAVHTPQAKKCGQ